MRRILIITAIIIFSLMFSCNPIPKTSEAESPTISVQLQTQSSDSNHLSESESAYPSPSTSQGVIIEVIPTPSDNLATITGVILHQTSDTPKPAAGILLGLADIIPGSSGEPIVASYNPGTSLRTLTDSAGRFVFTNVTPGQYALILDRITDSFLLNDPETGGDFLFNAEANKTLDLGELIFDSLPETSE